MTLLLFAGREDSLAANDYAIGDPCPCCGAHGDYVEHNGGGEHFCLACDEAWGLEDAA